jgi:hypothetical protein
MSKNNNRWPSITNIFQEAKPDGGGTFGQLCKWIGIGTLVLFALRCIGEWF